MCIVVGASIVITTHPPRWITQGDMTMANHGPIDLWWVARLVAIATLFAFVLGVLVGSAP